MYGVQRRIVVVGELPNRCYETSEHLLALLFQGQRLRFRIIIVIQLISAFHGKPCVFIIIFFMLYASDRDIIWTGTFWDKLYDLLCAFAVLRSPWARVFVSWWGFHVQLASYLAV